MTVVGQTRSVIGIANNNKAIVTGRDRTHRHRRVDVGPCSLTTVTVAAYR
jgi:hypothetical protein